MDYKDYYLTLVDSSNLSTNKKVFAIILSILLSLIIVIGPFVFIINLEMFNDLNSLFKLLLESILLIFFTLINYFYLKQILDTGYIFSIIFIDDLTYLFILMIIFRVIILQQGWF